MCGIVGYFGLSPRGINAILTGMSSIKYRAPDSTGIGWFGDENEPIRVKRCLGPIDNLVGPLLSDNSRSSGFELFRSLYSENEYEHDLRFGQLHLLSMEGFSKDSITTTTATYEELLSRDSGGSKTITPGTAGTPYRDRTFSAASKDQLSELLHILGHEYDLSPNVLLVLLKTALKQRYADVLVSTGNFVSGRSVSDTPVKESVLSELENQINMIQEQQGLDSESAESWENPAAYAALWEEIKNISLSLPQDYDRDAVRSVFNIIDSSLLAGFPFKPQVREQVDEQFRSLIHPGWNLGPITWIECLRLEKELNVYGIAAAAALMFLQKQERFTRTPSTELDSAVLQFFSTPVLAHGRWAIQSPVTIENAHPFFDAEKKRMLALNGQFNGRIETELKEYLKICGYTFRSDNSSEYAALLWGHYFDILSHDKRKMERTQSQVNAGLEKYAVGSQSIDYTIYNTIKGKTERQIDEIAFIHAARSICEFGGQIAVTGISLHSPHSMYVVSHNRPVYITRPKQSDEVMVVSDLNAALGLFTQDTIQEKRKDINRLTRLYEKRMQEQTFPGGNKKEIRKLKNEFFLEKMKLLECFTIRVLPLEGEELFARITNSIENDRVYKNIEITDFEGEIISDIEEFETVIDPTEEKNKVYSSFYETHLREIPDRLRDMTQTYLPEDAQAPLLTFRHKFLSRRFGPNLERCERIVLMGMGTSYHAGLMTKQLLYQLIPGKQIITLRPIDIIQIEKHINPETDLVFMLSWSGTTADMVETAKQFVRNKTTIIAVTNKPFSDLGLAAWRSGGIINVYTGEELTSSAVKSTLSMMYALLLFGIWYTSLSGKKRTSAKYLKLLEKIPAAIEGILKNYTNTDLSSFFPCAVGECSRLIVIDDLNIRNTGYETVLKLEENSGHLVGKTVDYSQLYECNTDCFRQGSHVIVGATCSDRLAEAVDCMKFLYLLNIPFTAFTTKNKSIETIKYYSNNRMLLAPALENSIQPFADLILYYIYTYHYSLKSANVVPGFPRNRAKSVTTSRSRSVRFSSPQSELAAISRFSAGLNTDSPTSPGTYTFWEQHTNFQWEKEIYKAIIKLTGILFEESSFETLIDAHQCDTERGSSVIIDHLEEEGELVLFPLDKQAKAGAQDFITVWRYLMKGQIRIEDHRESLARQEQGTPVIFIASRKISYKFLSELASSISLPALWIGPALTREQQALFSNPLGFLTLKDNFTCIAHLSVYTALSSVILHLLEKTKPKRAQPVSSLLKGTKNTLIDILLNCESVHHALSNAALDTSHYETAFCVSPFPGTADEWEEKSELGGELHLVGHSYGESGHGPLSTIDSDIKNKFVLIEERDKMINLYGKSQVIRWEKKYTGGNRLDTFSDVEIAGGEVRQKHPFFAEGYWFLPVLRPDYNFKIDNLIILDAASNRYTDQALDEFGSYKARYAKMVIITQRHFERDTSKEGLYDYPGAELISLPCLKDKQGNDLPIPDMYLPFVHTILATRFAASTSHQKTISCFPQQNIDLVFTRAFGLLGQTMRRLGIEIHGLTRDTITALKSLSPFVDEIAGAGCYDVTLTEEEEQLSQLTNSDDAPRTAKLIEHFNLLKDQKKPFFLLKPVKESFDGAAVEASEELFEGNWDQWFEGFGNSWQTLASGNVGIIESRTGIPLIELPIISPEKSASGTNERKLYHFYVHYKEWDYSRPLESQIEPTLNAMQKGFLTRKLESSGYITLLNCFNELMLSSHIVWEDWLIGLVTREFLFRKNNEALGQLLAHRIEKLLLACFVQSEQSRVGDIKKEFTAVWPTLEKYTPENDETRWNLILSLLTEQHR